MKKNYIVTQSQPSRLSIKSLNIYSPNLRLSSVLLFRNNISGDTVRCLIHKHQHRHKRQRHQTECDAEPDKGTRLNLCVHAVRYGLAYGFDTAECGAVANVGYTRLDYDWWKGYRVE